MPFINFKAKWKQNEIEKLKTIGFSLAKELLGNKFSIKVNPN